MQNLNFRSALVNGRYTEVRYWSQDFLLRGWISASVIQSNCLVLLIADFYLNIFLSFKTKKKDLDTSDNAHSAHTLLLFMHFLGILYAFIEQQSSNEMRGESSSCIGNKSTQRQAAQCGTQMHR